MNTNANMAIDDAIAIDVADGSAGSPSEGGADQAQADVPKESKVEKTSPMRTQRGKLVWLGLIFVMTAALVVGLLFGLGFGRDGNASSAVEQQEPSSVEIGGDTQIGRGSETNEDERKADSNDGFESATTTEPTPITPRFSTSPSDPIQVQLRTIDPTIMDGYASGAEGCAELYEDIYNATLLVANEEIKRVAEQFDRYTQKWPSGGVGGGPVFAGEVQLEMVDSVASVAQPLAPAPAMDSAGANQEDSFGSNNQEEGVDESDLVKSDGSYVYMAYGDLLLVTDAITGEEVSRTQMPPKEKNVEDMEPYPEPIGPILTPIAVEEISEVDGGEMDPALKEEGGDRKRRASMWIPPNPKPRISGLLFDGKSNRLAVIVSGYGDNYRYNYLDGPILRDHDDVYVLLYDTSAISTDGKPLNLITSRKMGGSYRSARMIGSTAHIAVQSGVEWHRHITRYLDRWQVVYDGLNKTEYLEVAAEQAKIAAANFSTRLIKELKLLADNDDETDDCSGVTKIALFTSAGEDGEDGDDALPDALSSGGALNSYLQISSFDMNMFLEWNVDKGGAEENAVPVMTMKTAG